MCLSGLFSLFLQSVSELCIFWSVNREVSVQIRASVASMSIHQPGIR